MKNFTKNIVLAGLLTVSNNVFAVQYSAEGQITGMFTGANNTMGVFHSAQWFNPANCPSGGGDKAYLLNYGSAADWSKVTSMLLAAYTSGKDIKIGVSSTECFSGYPVITRVAFKKGY